MCDKGVPSHEIHFVLLPAAIGVSVHLLVIMNTNTFVDR